MKKVNVAFLYNVCREKPDLNNPSTLLEADFDSKETVQSIIRNLTKCGYKVIPIEADESAYSKLYDNRNNIDIAFNYSEGICGRDREVHIPAMLEMLKIPYIGCPPLTQALIFNKTKTKDILMMNSIPTLPYQLFKTGDEEMLDSLKFPLIVKPVAQGQSAGITKNSLVKNEGELRKEVNFIIKTFSQYAFAEPFLEGREFSVGMIGNPLEILPFVELDHSSLPDKFLPFASLEVKFTEDLNDTKDFLICPAKVSSSLKKKIEDICIKLWHALEIEDWCRIDLRCDKEGNPYVLEVNSPASIEPPDTVLGYSSFPLAAEKGGYSYQDLLKRIIISSLKKHGIRN